mmetsp:Transcript_69994/g.221772  ORF Transcript_69994/g.221772 Transcript_69994/m.221772 type:complete len:226 (+) Transcript_69994:492-1169(+)
MGEVQGRVPRLERCRHRHHHVARRNFPASQACPLVPKQQPHLGAPSHERREFGSGLADRHHLGPLPSSRRRPHKVFDVPNGVVELPSHERRPVLQDQAVGRVGEDLAVELFALKVVHVIKGGANAYIRELKVPAEPRHRAHVGEALRAGKDDGGARGAGPGRSCALALLGGSRRAHSMLQGQVPPPAAPLQGAARARGGERAELVERGHRKDNLPPHARLLGGGT